MYDFGALSPTRFFEVRMRWQASYGRFGQEVPGIKFLARGQNMDAIRNGVFVAVLAMSLQGCTSVPSGAGERKAAEQVKVYEAGRLFPGQFETIKPLWVGAWRSAFWVPEFRTAEEGIAALQEEAGRLGADGLTDVACYRNDRGQLPFHRSYEPVFICYGSAVRVRKTAG